MITTIIVVDSFIEDALYNTLNYLKRTSCAIVKLDMYSTTKDNIHTKIQEFITNEMETQTFNITKILFVNFDVLESNVESEVFVGEVAKLYDLDLHDPGYKSWGHINDCFVTLSKSFEIENVDFVDINHLVYYESYLNALKHVEQSAIGNEAFNVNMNYLSKFCSLEQSETIKSSTNWLNTLFGTFYSQNNELKEFLDTYFQVNNTNLSFLENQVEDSLNIFSKEFVEYRQNTVVNTETTSEVHILLIPMHYYENDLEGLLTVMEGSLKDKCYIGLINEHDGVDDVNELTKNIVDVVHGISDAPTINVNILYHIPKNVGADEVALSKYVLLSFQEGDESVNILKDILTRLSENSKVNTAVFGFSNTPEKENGNALKYFQEIISQFESSKIKIVMDEVTQNNDILYKPLPISSLSHYTVVENGELMRELKQSRSLDFISESLLDTFTSRTKLNKLILYDASLSQYLPEVYASITSDTEILVYRYDETFDEIKQKILRLNQLPNVSFSNISLFKRDPQSFYFSLFDEEQSLKQDVEKDTVYGEEIIEQMLSQTDEELGIDLSLNTREEFIEDIYKSKAEYYLYYNGPDPSLNTWEKFSDFLMFLQDDIKVENFDILTCQIVGDDWEYILNNLQSRLNSMTIHSSIDTTGHTMFHGDWILETPENKNLVGIYFNDNIYDVQVKLDSEVFTSLDTLKTAIRNYARVIPYSGTGYIPPIENWVIKITHLNNICAHLISSLRHSLYPCEFSKIDGMSQWDISYVTNLDSAFYNNNTNNLFNAPIGNWNTVNVTSMSATFRDAVHFDQDLSNWKTDKVTSMSLMFYKAYTFDQNLSTWNVSNVKSMNQMFRYSYSFNGNISGWTVDNVTDMQYMFNKTYTFDKDLSNWNVTSNLSSHPTKLDSMFREAPGFTKVLTGDWENVPYDARIDQNMFGWHADYELRTPQTQGHINLPYDAVTGFTESGELKCALQLYFKNNIYAESLFGEIGTWNIENMTHLNYLFTNNSPRNSNPPNLNNWNTSNVVDMEGAFKDAGYFNQPLDKWDVSKVTNMKDMFHSSWHFNQDLSVWDTQKVEDMTNMFYNCRRFNWYIGGWNTNNVTSMTNMFFNAVDYNAQFVNTGYVPDTSITGTAFSNKSELQTALAAWKADRSAAQTQYGHISKWDVSIVSDFSGLFQQSFAGSIPFSEDLNEWESGNVTNMSDMFLGCTYANPKITNWDTTKVTNLNQCFKQAREFCQDLSWNTGNVTTMVSTFDDARYSFNGDITNWNTENVTSMYLMFTNTYQFNRNLSNWNVNNVTNFAGMFLYAEGTNQVFTGPSWTNVTERLGIQINMLGSPLYAEQRVSIGFVNNSNVVPNDINLLRHVCKLFCQHKAAALINYPDISQWDFSNVTNIDNLFQINDYIYPNNLDIGNWDVTNVTSMKKVFPSATSLNIDFSNWTVSNVTDMTQMFTSCTHAKLNTIENWNVSNVTSFTAMFASCYSFNGQLDNWAIDSAINLDSMFSNCYLFNSDIGDWDLSGVLRTDSMFYNCYSFNKDVSSWNVRSLTQVNNMFYGCNVFRIDLSDWVLESVTVYNNIWYFLQKARSYEIVLDKTWTVLHEQFGKTRDFLVYRIFFNESPGTISTIPYNAPRVSFNSSNISNNTTYESDEIDVNLVVNTEVTESVGSGDLQITNGTVKNFYKKSQLEYTFVFTSVVFGQSSQITVNSNSTSLSDYIVEEPFVWTWSPPVTVMTFNSPDISNNQTQTSSSINVEINLSREFLTNTQLIQKEDISVTNGTVTGFQRIDNTQYVFTFIASSPNLDSIIEMESAFDASNAILPSTFTWTWIANIEQPTLTLASTDVADGGTIKKNEVDMLLTYTPNSKLAFASITETDISFTNGFIVSNSFAKKTPTQYSFKFKSLSRDTDSTIYIPQNQFQYNFVDGATNLTENYEGSSVFTWKYNGLDIKLINNKTVAVITSEQKDSKSLDLILHGNTTYDPVYNEYNFEKSTSDYITISGEVLNGSGEASISFWYKTKTTANTSFATLLTLRNDDNDNFTLQRYAIQDKFHIKSTGSGAINAVTTNLPYYNTDYVHMVVTFTATEILVYKNSVLEETHSVSNIIAGGERAFQMLGASVSSANVVYRYFNGYIKNLRFYNYAIPLTEVSALYTMYNTGMNDTAPQILSVNLTTTSALTNNEFPKAVINMEMDVTYDSVASISSIDTQSFIIDKSNFDTSFGYVFDFRQLSDTKVSFKFGASTTIYNSQLFLKQDTITRNINSNLNVVSNPESNVFTWKYKSEPLTIQSIKSNVGNTGSLTNQEVIWIQVIFSEEVFNFRKDYITGTNCKVIKTTGSGTTYAVKVQTFRPTSASIVIDIPSTLPITTGKGLNKALADANNATYNWDYDNIIPTFTIETSRESGLTNNADYVDITVVTSRSTTTFDIDSLNVNGSAEIVNFSGSGQNYSYRLQPFASSEISVTLPSNAFSDDYGNQNTTLDTFTWTYHNIKPEVYIASQDINSGDSADLGSIETYFVFSKPVSGFTLADVDITNGNLSELTQSTTFPEHENTYTVTIGSKASANNPYASKGSSSAFFLNGEEAKVVSFVAGNTYTFNNASNSAHPLKFYTDAEKTSGSEYTTGVTVSATSTIIVVDSNTPTTLYYQCEAHEYMGNMITYGESYKATLIPASSSVSISLQIADNKVKDSLGIFNDTASNSFVWNYTGTEYMVSIESPDLKSGASHLYNSIQVSLTLTYATFDTIDPSIFTIVNGTITDISGQGGESYTFTLESVTPNTETSLLLSENSVTRYDNNSEGNKASNKFVWTYTPPIPELTITSSDVKQGAFTNNSSIDLQLDFTENVVFDVNTINITNGSGTLSGANNSYVLTVVPDVVADSSADILVNFPEGTGFYNYFDNEELYNDVSYNYSWKYDSVIPTGTIVSSIDIVYQDVCSNQQIVPFTIEFNKSMPSLEVNDFTITSNGALSGLNGSDSLYSFVVSALDNTIDNTLSFKLGDGAITDEAGNAFSSSNEFSFTINAKVSAVLDPSSIAGDFNNDTDIPDEDKLSLDEINMILAVEVPDLTVPNFDEEEGGEVTVDVSYTVTVDTKTSSNSYYNQGSSSAYFIDDTEAPSLALDSNNVYRFNQDDATNSGHPLFFYEDVDKSVQYTTDVSVNGTPGTTGSYTQISITSETPTTLYYQCGNHDYMGGTITVGEVDTVPVVVLPTVVKITNNKVFTKLINQILEKAEDVTAIKMGIDDVTLSETATEKIPDVEQVVMAKSNQIEPPVVIDNTDTDSVLFVPLANVGDLVKVEINGVAYLTVVNSDNTFGLKIDNVDARAEPFNKDDVYVIDDTNSIIFGSQIISSSPPPPSPPTVEITSSIVQAGATTTTGDIVLDLSFSTTIEIDLANIYPLTSSTQITSSSIQSVDSSNSIVVVSVSPILPDVSAELGIVIYDTTFYSTSANVDYYNDISFSFSWNYDATAYNNANVVEVVVEYEPVFINPTTGLIPCFLKDTNILTTKGYKKVQYLIPGEDKLIDHKNKVIECLEVKKYVKQNDGKEYPHRIPRGSQLSSEFTCNQDLFLTYNHCVYLPGNNMFAPVSLMKNIKQHVTNDPYFVYYHVFTSNYFSDTIIANGIPCETHSKYAFNYLRGLDSSGKLLKKVMKHANMQINCQRNRISRKDYKKLIKKSERNIKNKKQPKK